MKLGSLDQVNFEMAMEFQHPVHVDTFPGFVLRSVLGMQLKRMHCAMRDTDCAICPFNATCAYSFIFESPISKNTVSLQGRDRASHPFRIQTNTIPDSVITRMAFRIILFGRATIYLPHVIYAFREAAINGLFRSRTPATLASVTVDGREILYGDRIMLEDVPKRTIRLDSTEETGVEGQMSVICQTPLRFKTDGRYSTDFSGSAFLAACLRRSFSMFENYGDLEPGAHQHLICALREEYGSDTPVLQKRALRWVEFLHYSGRQHEAMKLGGVMGTFELAGVAPALSWSALKCCASLGAGKNCSFGYGSIQVENIEERSDCVWRK